MGKLISIIVPCYNEQETVERFYEEIIKVTNEIKEYAKKVDKSSNTERNGCVVVDKRLAEILQMVMEKYTFQNVDYAWLKLCYYYDYIGPKAK